MKNAHKLKDWLVVWRFGAIFHLNERACFKQNDAVSCGFKKKQKKERRNGAVLRRHCFFFFFPRTCSRGRDVFCFLLFVSSFPSHVLCSPCPYKYHPNAGKKEDGRKRGGRLRERETETKKTGENRGGGRKEKERRKRSRAERQTWRRTQDRRRKPAGWEGTYWCLYTAEKKRRRCH